MKLLLLAAAPFAFALAGPVAAQDHVVRTTTVTRHVDKSDHHVGPNHGWHWKKVCSTSWKHHRKIRSCKNVRVRW
jgi:hypothetical protein